MPENQTQTEGNDDQVFWAFTAMDAAELNYVAPNSISENSGYPSWVSMGQAVFNEQTTRWDNSTCGGGLRWQIFQWNNGYDYKNVASNGGFFQLAARLARYTGNETYVEWAQTEWDWFSNSILYDPDTHKIYDGTSDKDNCSEVDHTQWTYNYGQILVGLAYLYNHVSFVVTSRARHILTFTTDRGTEMARPCGRHSGPDDQHFRPGQVRQHHGRVGLRALRHLHNRSIHLQRFHLKMAGCHRATDPFTRLDHLARDSRLCERRRTAM